MSETLPKAERLSGTASVSALFGHGKGFSHGSLRCKVLPRQDSVMPGPNRASARPSSEENYFLEGFPKNQFPSSSSSLMRADASPSPDENYFSGQCPKNQFSSGIASLMRADASRIVVSVPKRLFKRAVKRNLLKRRIREAYRRQKAILQAPVDILFIYAAAEVLPYEVIFADMTALLTAVSASVMPSPASVMPSPASVMPDPASVMPDPASVMPDPDRASFKPGVQTPDTETLT